MSSNAHPHADATPPAPFDAQFEDAPVAHNAPVAHFTALAWLFTCVDEHCENLAVEERAAGVERAAVEERPAVEERAAVEERPAVAAVVAKPRKPVHENPCWHTHIDFHATETTGHTMLVCGGCLGHQSDPDFKCDKQRILGCLVCPPQTRAPHADKTVCMLITRSPADTKRAAATHLKCPKHQFWLGVNMLYQLDGCGKECMGEKVREMKSYVEAQRRLFPKWRTLYQAKGLMKNADDIASVRFAKAAKVLDALAA